MPWTLGEHFLCLRRLFFVFMPQAWQCKLQRSGLHPGCAEVHGVLQWCQGHAVRSAVDSHLPGVLRPAAALCTSAAPTAACELGCWVGCWVT